MGPSTETGLDFGPLQEPKSTTKMIGCAWLRNQMLKLRFPCNGWRIKPWHWRCILMMSIQIPIDGLMPSPNMGDLPKFWLWLWHMVFSENRVSQNPLVSAFSPSKIASGCPCLDKIHCLSVNLDTASPEQPSIAYGILFYLTVTWESHQFSQ